MDPPEFKARTRALAVAVIRLARTLRPTTVSRTIAAQLIRAAGGTAANYRAACRARSRAEFVARLGTVLEEADEAAFWLEVLVASGEQVRIQEVRRLENEVGEIVAMTVSSIRTAARGLPARHPARRGEPPAAAAV